MTEFEAKMRAHMEHASSRLENDFMGSKQAMILQAMDKVREFQLACDTILEEDAKEFLTLLIIGSMFQSFSYGYGIGKIEGETLKKVML